MDVSQSLEWPSKCKSVQKPKLLLETVFLSDMYTKRNKTFLSKQTPKKDFIFMIDNYTSKYFFLICTQREIKDTKQVFHLYDR